MAEEQHTSDWKRQLKSRSGLKDDKNEVLMRLSCDVQKHGHYILRQCKTK